MNKLLFTIISGFIICFYLNIYDCDYCSRIFVWWLDIFGIDYLKYYPILYSFLAGLHLAIILFFNKNNSVRKILHWVLIINAIIGILFWIYTIVIMQIYFSYFIYIIFHIIFLYLLYSLKSEEVPVLK